MIYLLLTAALISFAVGCGPGLVAWLAVLYWFVHSLRPDFTVVHYLCLTLFVVAVPLAGWLAAAIVEKFCFNSLKVPALREASVLLCLLMMLGDAGILDHLTSASRILSEAARPWPKSLSLFLAGINSVLLCAGVTAVCLMSMVLLLELPVRWLTQASGTRLWLPFGALRPLAVLIVACLAFNLIAAFFVAELAPTSILQKVR